MKSEKQSTLDDVANLAGVSKGTVSNVLNQKPWVHAETVRKVRAAMAQLNYTTGNRQRRPGRRPGHKLRKRPGKKSFQVLFVSVGMPRSLMSGTFYGGILYGVEAAVSESSGTLHIRHCEDERMLEKVLRRPDVDGAIVLNAVPLQSEEILASGCPVVKVLGSETETLKVDCVDYCADRVAKIAVKYLSQQGCKDVVFLGPSIGGRVALREMEFLDLAQSCGMKGRAFTDPNLVHVDQRSHSIDGERLAALVNRAFKGPKMPDGVFLPMDMMAPELYAALRTLKIRPGTDVHVISCNNEQFLLAGLQPKPATIDIHAEEIGKRAVFLLEWRMRYPSAPLARMVVEPRLIV
jgi:LacI family transcriptional regulator